MKLDRLTNNILTIDDFLTVQECNRYILKSETIGYEPATVDTEKGQIVNMAVRNNNRVLYKDSNLAYTLWETLKVFAPTEIGKSNAIGLNELFRFYKYQPGQEFKKHRDQSFIRNEIEASYYTFMVYLNDDYTGGETIFDRLKIEPKQGRALIFFHDLEHEGSSVKRGIKYVLRSDIMYRLDVEFD